ncbi:hypothetical protein BDW02DRAFT_506014 [Decorospora gaudefroyi]|uniref:Zn(2)-C6 fungal-type domain-containing protein n=1 Tax=Decorospora gaudefroyi TaxID=184978 RepID=A0A6A5K1A8_9PLEO|nr:hypothetical protein BDW02DRAFT_506014 [Decorospora gaudefroyi]
MAETITVSSPSLVLRSPDSAPINLTSARKTASGPLPASKNSAKASQTTGVTKRKQSKSRNGCSTCKAKRLKCDEGKPACAQCARRAVTCGGYKKDFKWRPFEEPNVPGKPQLKSRKDSPPPFQDQTSFHDGQYAFTSVPPNSYYPPPPPSSYSFRHGPPLQTCFSQHPFTSTDNMFTIPLSSFVVTPQSTSPVDSYAPGSLGSQSLFGTESVNTKRTKNTADSSVSSGQSPRLADLLIPGTDLNVPPEEYSSFLSQHEAFYQPTGLTPPAPMDDDIEGLVDVNVDPEAWIMRLGSPALSSSSGGSSDSPEFRIPAQMQLSFTSPESLTRRYDRDTCGVLSVKDGPTENPWRTLVWPLARDCPALYHAIASMTSFHQSNDIPTMRIQGIDHMRNAVHALAAGLQNMRFDAAISTTLVLAFAESWDQHISTGINHIKGAKILINQALMQHRQTPKQGEEWTRLKFLCNTWIYMDVIARLTSADEDETYDVDTVQESIYATGETDMTLDPLMGCARTLFPIIGRVANLVRKVRRLNSNGPTIISQALLLKSQLEKWKPPSYIEDPEDETTSPHDTIKTAVAYQYATLLYLHQAVPELPSQTSSALAKKVLCELATVEPRSRSIIVHIYPLMAAGCEATEHEDREWVKERWGLMSSRMKLGIIERCLEVTKEVWNRRDAHIAERMAVQMDDMRTNHFPSSDAPIKREFDAYLEDFEADGEFCWLDAGPKRRAVESLSSYSAPFSSPVVEEPPQWAQFPTSNVEELEAEATVKGRLHWLGVMKDWNWEILLG